jgi:hypothetical protein
MSTTPPSSTPPPPAILLQMLTGEWLSFALATAAHYGIADHLESGPKSPAELAALTTTNEQALYRLLRATASVGVFTELEDGRFAQTTLSEPLRTKAVPSVRGMAMMLLDEWHAHSWAQLPWVVATGRPAPFKLYDMAAFDYLSADPARAVNFNTAMTNISQMDSPAIAAAYDFSRFRSIVDVAGGMGMLLSEILKKTPQLQGTLFELPYVAEQARTSPVLAEVRDRCEFIGGSFLDGVPPGKDAYIMKHIIHDWDDKHSIRILSHCRKAMTSSGTLLIADQVVPGRNEPSPSKLMDLEMLVLPGGKERTDKEWSALFAASGFRLARIVATPAQICVIEGIPV